MKDDIREGAILLACWGVLWAVLNVGGNIWEGEQEGEQVEEGGWGGVQVEKERQERIGAITLVQHYNNRGFKGLRSSKLVVYNDLLIL